MPWPGRAILAARPLVCMMIGLVVCCSSWMGAGCGGPGRARAGLASARDQPAVAAEHGAPGIRVRVMRFAGDLGPAFARALAHALAQEVAQAVHRIPDGGPATAVQVAYGDAGHADVVVRGSARRQGRALAVSVRVTFTHADRLGAPDRMWSSEVLRIDHMSGGDGSNGDADADDHGEDALHRRARGMAAYLAGLSYYQDLVHEGSSVWARATYHLARASETGAPAVARRARLLLFYCYERTGAWSRAEQVARQVVQEAQDARDAGNLRGSGGARRLAHGLYMQAILAKKAGRLDEAIALARRSMDLMRAGGVAPGASAHDRADARRAKAVATGLIADVHRRRGELDVALSMFRDQVLPLFADLGDARARAMVLGLMADIHLERGALDAALRLRRDQELPIYEQLGDARALAMARANLALIHLEREEPGDRAEAARLLRAALDTADAMDLPEAAQIRAILADSDLPDDL